MYDFKANRIRIVSEVRSATRISYKSVTIPDDYLYATITESSSATQYRVSVEGYQDFTFTKRGDNAIDVRTTEGTQCIPRTATGAGYGCP